MKKKSIILFALAIVLTGFWACEDDEKTEDKPYVGSWSSNIFAGMTQTLDTVLQRMDFEFTNTTFTNSISQSTSLTDMTLNELVSIGGDVENTEDTTLNVSINTIELYTGASADRTQDETTFNALFNGALGYLLSKDFDATYSLYSNDDSMKLALPVKSPLGGIVTQVLRLGKQ